MRPDRLKPLTRTTEATVDEARLRQRSLLDVNDSKPLPQEIELKALELLTELLIASIPATTGAKLDEQNRS
jgi:hypothetical protein